MLNFEDRRARVHAIATFCENAMIEILNDRQMFSRFADAVNASRAVQQTYFVVTVSKWYSQSMLMALRRLADRDSRANSLRTLFDEMMSHPTAWSFDGVLALWSADRERREWTEEYVRFALTLTYPQFAGSDGQSLDVARVQRDREALDAAVQDVRTMVDREVAHSQRGWTPMALTFADLNRTIDHVHALIRPYIALITGAGYADMTPTETSDWWRIFTPWRDLRPFFRDEGEG